MSLFLLTQRAAFAQTQLAAPIQERSQATSQPQRGAFAPELGLYVDATLSMGVDEASRQVFKPFKLFLNRSLEPTVRWLKVQVQAPAGRQTSQVLIVGPYFLADLELYYEDRGRWVRQLSGAKYPGSQQNCFFGHHCFTLPDAGVDPRTYFLRVHTLNGFYVSTKVLTSDRLANETTSTGLLYGVQLGMLLTLIGWSAVYLIRFRTLVVGWFCLTQVAALFLYCFSNGMILREFVAESPESYSPILTIAFCLRLMFATGLCLELLRRWKTQAWIKHYCLMWIVFWSAQICMSFFGHVKPYMLLLNWIFLFTAPIFFAWAIYKGEQLSRQLKLFWTLGAVLVGVLMAADAVLLITDSGSSLLTVIPGTGASMIIALALYSLLLGYSKMQQEQLLQTMFELNTLKAQNDYEQRQLKERSTLIDMLSHELKNPLATMRMALGSLQVIFGKSQHADEFNERFSSMTQSIDNMTQVIDRVGQVDAVDQKNFVVRDETLNVFEVVKGLPLFVEYLGRFKVSGAQQISIQTDKLLFVTIINNLLDNALKYSPLASVIEVSVSTTENKLLCTVSNEVERDHAPDPEALFTRYYRSTYSHDKPGTGLGLVLIKSLCERLKGSVSYRLDDNRVFFSIELPR